LFDLEKIKDEENCDCFLIFSGFLPEFTPYRDTGQE